MLCNYLLNPSFTFELKTEREQRISLESHLSEREKNLKIIQEQADTRVKDLESSYKERVEQLQSDFAIREKRDQKTIEEFKAMLEEQRQKHIVEIDHLKTAKSKSENSLAKLEGELSQQSKRCQDFEERAVKSEMDLQVLQHQRQEKEQELLGIKAEAKSYERVINNLKEEVVVWQQKFEKAVEQIGELKTKIQPTECSKQGNSE